MKRLHGYGWLIAGAAVALAVPASGGDRWLLNLLAPFPLPWQRLFLGLLLFGCALALYFRAYAAQLATKLRAERQIALAAAPSLREAAGDLERSAWVVKDNLLEMTNAQLPAEQSALYLQGALAHAERLPKVATRIRALGCKLGGSAEG